MHRKIIEGTLLKLGTERAAYFDKIANALEEDPRSENNANMVFSVLRDVMGDLPIYLERDELIDLLFNFINTHHEKLRNIMYHPDFIRDQSVLRRVTGLFVHMIVNKTLEKQEAGEFEENNLSVHKLTWPYRDTDLIDPEDDPEAWDEAVAKADSWDGVDRRKSGAARVDDMAAEKVREKEEKQRQMDEGK